MSASRKDNNRNNNADDKREESNADAQAPPSSTASNSITIIFITIHISCYILYTNNTQLFNVSLTRALLNEHFQLQLPSLPEGHLCPPLPNRANYICWLNELIGGSEQDLYKFSTAASDDDEDDDASSANNDNTEANRNDGHEWQCQGIDIGTGVSAIYPLLLTTDKC